MTRDPLRVRTRAHELRDAFIAQGAQYVEPSILLPAEILLDLYGEDIRGRSYTAMDPLRGEQMLRPDFTVPVVRMHLQKGQESARYTYAGPVFRRQEDDPERDNEYLQVGYEVFDSGDPSATDAEVFCRLSAAVADLRLRAATGDIGILIAAVEGLNTSDRRKGALRRHIWRPKKFRALLDRFSKPRNDLKTVQSALDAAPLIGLRSQEEINARLAFLKAEQDEPPISLVERDALDALLSVRETLPFALQQLSDIAVDLPSISPAVSTFKDRIQALSDHGVHVDSLEYEASYGRTSMEYYDGFVFGLYPDTRPDLPAVVTGGRYNALTRRLGGVVAPPAVGGVIRPDIIVQLEGDA